MSGEARTNRGSLRQVEGWLRANFPTPLPVRVRVVAKLRGGARHGHCKRIGDHLQITIALGWCFFCAVDKLCHEWAHAAVYQPLWESDEWVMPDHPAGWGDVLGKIEDAWDESDVNEFSPRPWK